MAINVGQGTILKMIVGGNSTAVAQVLEVTGPEVNVGAADTTNLGSTSKRKRAQLPDAGPLSFSVQYDPADNTHIAITTLVNTWPQQTAACEVDFNTANAHKASFQGFVSKFAPKGMNTEDNLEADVELTIDGLVTWS